MRDNRFIAIHMGGQLSMERHKLLIQWAINCVEHGIEILKLKEIDERALKAIEIAKKWEKGNSTVGEARKAAFSAHDAARECVDKSKQAIIRACGHATATAHMADHSLQAIAYVLKGLKFSKTEMEIEKEIDWQLNIADDQIKDLIDIRKIRNKKDAEQRFQPDIG
jgi:hypothetical protein